MGIQRDLGQGNRKNIRDQGLIGPVGYGSPVDYGTRAGWYNWNYDDQVSTLIKTMSISMMLMQDH